MKSVFGLLLTIPASIAFVSGSTSHASHPVVAAPRPLVIGVLSYEKDESSAPDSISRNAERGLAMGIEEARATAKLFGRDVVEKRVVIKRGDDAEKAARIMARTTMMTALLVTNPELIRAAESVATTGYAVIVLRTLPSSSVDCSRFVIAIYPPQRTLDSAKAAYARSSPRGQRPYDVPAITPSAQTELWSPKLERFGALELNDRYRARWKTGMTSEAWASWVAVKILSESALRKQSVEPYLILDYITKSEFDGHKGWPLSVRRADQVLRQPIYIVDALSRTRLAELPGGPRSDSLDAATVLDRILPPLTNSSCTERR